MSEMAWKLQLVSWPGGIHWYGNLHNGDREKIRLDYLPTAEQAKGLGDSFFDHPEGERSERFFNRADAIKAAIEYFTANADGKAILILGDTCFEARLILHVIGAEPHSVAALNDIAIECEAIGWYERNPERMEALSLEWGDMLHEIGFRVNADREMVNRG